MEIGDFVWEGAYFGNAHQPQGGLELDEIVQAMYCVRSLLMDFLAWRHYGHLISAPAKVESSKNYNPEA